jgi:hypothetical protein
MTMSDDPRELNPYASPTTPPGAETIAASSALLRKLKTLRLLVVWLGVLWIGVGLAIVAFAAAMFFIPNADPLFILPISGAIGVVGAVWVFVGSATCCKQLTAIYAGLVFSYLHLCLCAYRFNICIALVLVSLIVHAHWVLGLAKELRQKGIPLTTRPQDIETRLPPQEQ